MVRWVRKIEDLMKEELLESKKNEDAHTIAEERSSSDVNITEKNKTLNGSASMRERYAEPSTTNIEEQNSRTISVTAVRYFETRDSFK